MSVVLVVVLVAETRLFNARGLSNGTRAPRNMVPLNLLVMERSVHDVVQSKDRCSVEVAAAASIFKLLDC